MRLTELDPRWIGAGGDGIYNADGTPSTPRHGIGLMFLCPCGPCTAKRTGDRDKDFHLQVYVNVDPPLDGSPVWKSSPNMPAWKRTGDTFDTLKLTPSILSDPAKGGCGWHGYVGLNVPGEGTST